MIFFIPDSSLDITYWRISLHIKTWHSWILLKYSLLKKKSWSPCANRTFFMMLFKDSILLSGGRAWKWKKSLITNYCWKGKVMKSTFHAFKGQIRICRLNKVTELFKKEKIKTKMKKKQQSSLFEIIIQLSWQKYRT